MASLPFCLSRRFHAAAKKEQPYTLPLTLLKPLDVTYIGIYHGGVVIWDVQRFRENGVRIIIDIIGLTSLIGLNLTGILYFHRLEIESWFLEGLAVHCFIPLVSFIFVFFIEVPLLEKLLNRKKSDWIER